MRIFRRLGYLLIMLSVIAYACCTSWLYLEGISTYSVGTTTTTDSIVVLEIVSVPDTTTTTMDQTTLQTTTTISNPVNDYELYLLAHLIYAEAGQDSCSDDTQLMVGSVALNRVKSDYFPNTLYEVIYQTGQYSCTWNGGFEKEPNERAWKNAEYLLQTGSVLPNNVIFQAGFEQGDGTYTEVDGIYFCYKN